MSDGPGTYGTGNTTPCQEDMPCWDCATMGNHVCGTPVTATTVVLDRVPTNGLAGTGVETADLVGGALMLLVTGAALMLAKVRLHVKRTGEG